MSYSFISRCITRDTTMEVVDLLVHPLASIMAFNCTTFGGCRTYGQPSCLNYGQSFFIQQRLSSYKNPTMLLCVTRFHSSLDREAMHYFTIHDLRIHSWQENLEYVSLLLTIKKFFTYLIQSYLPLNLNSWTLVYGMLLTISYPLKWVVLLVYNSQNLLRLLIQLMTKNIQDDMHRLPCNNN